MEIPPIRKGNLVDQFKKNSEIYADPSKQTYVGYCVTKEFGIIFRLSKVITRENIIGIRKKRIGAMFDQS